MKKIIVLFLVVFATSIASAQELTWHKDVNKAIEISKKENKPMMMFFTGSDWCGWCIRLQKEVFKTPEFIEWAKKNVVLVELDFPRRTPQPDAEKMQNNSLQQTFAVRGYPSVYFVKAGTNANGTTNFEQLGQTGYVAGGPSAWLGVANPMIQKFTPYSKETSKKKS